MFDESLRSPALFNCFLMDFVLHGLTFLKTRAEKIHLQRKSQILVFQ